MVVPKRSVYTIALIIILVQLPLLPLLKWLGFSRFTMSSISFLLAWMISATFILGNMDDKIQKSKKILFFFALFLIVFILMNVFIWL